MATSEPEARPPKSRIKVLSVLDGNLVFDGQTILHKSWLEVIGRDLTRVGRPKAEGAGCF